MNMTNDYGFEYFTWICSRFLDIEGYFAVIGLLYILPVYFAVKKICPNNIT